MNGLTSVLTKTVDFIGVNDPLHTQQLKGLLYAIRPNRQKHFFRSIVQNLFAVDFLRFVFKIQLYILSILHDKSLILEYVPIEQGGWFKSTLSHWHPSALLRGDLG